MKLIEILNSKGPLNVLVSKRFTNFKTVRSLVALTKKVEEECDFYLKEEKKLVDEYAVKDKDGNPIVNEGRISLPDLETKEKFEAEIAKLRDLEIDSIEKVTLLDKDFKSTDDIPTPQEVLLLECIIDFKEEE